MRDIGVVIFFVMFVVVWREGFRESHAGWRDVVFGVFRVIVTLVVVGAIGLAISAA